MSFHDSLAQQCSVTTTIETSPKSLAVNGISQSQNPYFQLQYMVNLAIET